MLKILLLFLIFFNFSFSKDSIPKKTKIAYLVNGIEQLRFKDSRIALSMWFNELSTEINTKIEILYYNDSKEMLEDFINHKYEYAMLNTYFYLKNYKKIDPFIEEFWSIRKGETRLNNYLLITHSDNKINDIKDILDKRLVLKYNYYLDKIFLDASLSKAFNKNTNFQIDISYSNSFSRIILDIFFKKYDVAVVPEYSYNLASEMNPIIKKKTKILTQSNPIYLPIVSFFHKNTNQKLIDAFSNRIETIKSTAAGENILNLFKMKEVYKVDEEVIRQQKEILNSLSPNYFNR